MPKESDKPRFEPPPWEREAFDRFEQERSRRRAAEDLDQALAEVFPAGIPAKAKAERPPLELVVPRVRTTEPGQDAPAPEPATDADTAPVLSEARIDSMLIQLRSEEPTVAPVNLALINVVCATLAIFGLMVIVQAAVLFAGVKASEMATTLLAGTMSLVVFLTGLGMLAGAGLLFRKYHR